MMFNWLSLVTGFFYIVLGIVVLVYKFFFVIVEPPVAYALGILLIIYGIFRITRAVLRLREKDDE